MMGMERTYVSTYQFPTLPSIILVVDHPTAAVGYVAYPFDIPVGTYSTFGSDYFVKDSCQFSF